MNQGVVLIKPHANNPEFLHECLAHLKEAGVYVINGFGKQCTKDMADTHYKNIAQYSREIPEKSSFVSMVQYMKDRPSLSAEEMCILWRNGIQLTVDKDYYVSKIGDTWVSNGFYAFMQEDFDNRDATVLVVKFNFPFLKFKDDVIGCTNAAKAPKTSLRGMYYAKYCTPATDLSRNGVHASASALEGFRDCVFWGGIDKRETLLWKTVKNVLFLEQYLYCHEFKPEKAKRMDNLYGDMETDQIKNVLNKMFIYGFENP
jgi:nucleoside diphosphate kinase